MCKVQIIVDESAPSSLELVQRLSSIGTLDRQSEGFYLVDAPAEQDVLNVTDEFPETVMRVETV